MGGGWGEGGGGGRRNVGWRGALEWGWGRGEREDSDQLHFPFDQPDTYLYDSVNLNTKFACEKRQQQKTKKKQKTKKIKIDKQTNKKAPPPKKKIIIIIIIIIISKERKKEDCKHSETRSKHIKHANIFSKHWTPKQQFNQKQINDLLLRLICHHFTVVQVLISSLIKGGHTENSSVLA